MDKKSVDTTRRLENRHQIAQTVGVASVSGRQRDDLYDTLAHTHSSVVILVMLHFLPGRLKVSYRSVSWSAWVLEGLTSAYIVRTVCNTHPKRIARWLRRRARVSRVEYSMDTHLNASVLTTGPPGQVVRFFVLPSPPSPPAPPPPCPPHTRTTHAPTVITGVLFGTPLD